MCVVVDFATMEFYIDSGTKERNNESILLTLEDYFTNPETAKAVIAFFISADKTKWSIEAPLFVTP